MLCAIFAELLQWCILLQVKKKTKWVQNIFEVVVKPFSNFSCMFLNPNIFFQIWILILLIYYIWETSSRNKLKKKTFYYQKLFWPFTVWINCSCDLKKFANFWPSGSNFKRFFWSLKHFFLAVGQNNSGNKIPSYPYKIYCVFFTWTNWCGRKYAGDASRFIEFQHCIFSIQKKKSDQITNQLTNYFFLT